MKNKTYDFIIIGAGIMGLSIAYKLITNNPKLKIAIIEKEKNVALHASGKNSGVLHSGFFNSIDSLKAKFTKSGNEQLKEFCKHYKLKINFCGRIIVASNEKEFNDLCEFKHRGDLNNIESIWISQQEAHEIDPNAKIYNKALFSPTTATIDPIEICYTLLQILKDRGIQFFFETEYLRKSNSRPVGITTTNGNYEGEMIINAAGLYADKIAKDFGLSQEYTLLPFKEIYLKTSLPWPEIKTNIYCVPNLKNPFLSVHFIKTVNNHIKIGSMYIPAFWRENYTLFERFKLSEFKEILWYEIMLFLSNSCDFRNLTFKEIKKINKNHLISQAKKLVNNLTAEQYRRWETPGIHPQLLKKSTLKLVDDFKIEGGIEHNSIHVLNATNPAFTCSFSFADWIIAEFIYKS
ncbi:MAG: FAD-dependent oxidoreductase [Oligoflexia bacterium]|nr:FAD-dependent oxidoreductase [Oligoflexia bacterium]